MLSSRRRRGRVPRWTLFLAFMGIGVGTGYATRYREGTDESQVSAYVTTNLWLRKSKKAVEITRVAVKSDPLNVPDPIPSAPTGPSVEETGKPTVVKPKDPGQVASIVRPPQEPPPVVLAPPPDEEPRARSLIEQGRKAMDRLEFGKAQGLFREVLGLKVALGTVEEAGRWAEKALVLDGVFGLVKRVPKGDLSGWVEVELRVSGRISGRLVQETPDFIEVERTARGGTSRIKVTKGNYERLVSISRQEREFTLQQELQKRERDAQREGRGIGYVRLASFCYENGFLDPIGRLLQQAVDMDPSVRKAYYEELAKGIYIEGSYYLSLQDFKKANQEWNRLKAEFPESALVDEVNNLMSGKKPGAVASVPEAKDPSPVEVKGPAEPGHPSEPIEPVGPPPSNEPAGPFDPVEPARPAGPHTPSPGLDAKDREVAKALGIELIEYRPSDLTAEADKAFEAGRDILRANPPGTGGFQSALRQARSCMEDARSKYQEALSRDPPNRAAVDARLQDVQRTIYMIKKSSNIY